MTRWENLVGKRYGRLVVVEKTDGKSKSRSYWKCKCDCGNDVTVRADGLKSGHAQSCGCLAKERAAERIAKINTTHGGRKTRLYNIWAHVKERCLNPNSISYQNYGGRGICVCEEWRESFGAFYKWAMENGYRDDLTIDRIDNDGNYCPENCRWATKEEQVLNRRNNVYLEFNGERKTVSEWAAEMNVSPKYLYDRIKSGWSAERALTEIKKRRT